MLRYGKYQGFPDERHDLDGSVGVRQRAHMLGDTSLQGGWMGETGEGGAANEASPSPVCGGGCKPSLGGAGLACRCPVLPLLPELMKVTGHKDLKMLRRYHHCRAEDLARSWADGVEELSMKFGLRHRPSES